MTWRRALLALGSTLAAAALCLACNNAAGQTLQRGDRLLAVGDTEAAIAEYKLALRQHGESPDVLLRLGNAYAASGDVEAARRYYDPVLAADSAYRYQVAAGLLMAARVSLAGNSRENALRALQPLLDWSMGLIPEDLRLPMARRYWSDGDYATALALYLSVLPADPSAEPDSLVSPADLYETGRAYEELGGCSESLDYFEAYLAGSRHRDPRVQGAQWHLGNCLFAVAEDERSSGRPRTALEHLNRMVELGVPQTLLDRAQFLRGELLLALGQPDSALAAYREVLRLNPARTGPMVEQAQRRIRELRSGYQP